MKNYFYNRQNKGITLIALVITIVVLLILAAVAIAAIQNENILSHANNAAVKYNQAVQNEQDTLGGYLNFLDNLGGSGATIGDAEVGTKTTSLSTINGQEYSANNPVIPAGFIPINTATSSWDGADLAAEVKKGLVITDSVDSNGVSNGNEFVWIPVAEINSFARLQDGSDVNYEGVLYNFTSTGATEKTSYGVSTTSIREPANLTGTNSSGVDQSDKADRFTTIEWNANYYQESFNKMVNSVAKYKGFYVGRYEMSINATSGKAESVAGATPASASASSANMWWGLYEKALTYSTTGVISEMIWGCQYDAMLKFILTGPDASHVTAKTNVGHTSTEFTSMPYYTGGTNYSTVYTGSTEYNDIASNIYDLEGNAWEWTQEATNTDLRVYRGGSCSLSNSPSFLLGKNPTLTGYLFGSRLALYVGL